MSFLDLFALAKLASSQLLAKASWRMLVSCHRPLPQPPLPPGALWLFRPPAPWGCRGEESANTEVLEGTLLQHHQAAGVHDRSVE